MEENKKEEKLKKEDVVKIEADPADVEKNKGMAIISYFLFFIPMLTDAKDSKFAMFHANQSLVLLLTAVGVQIIGMILAMVTFGFGAILLPIIFIGIIVLWIMGIVNAANGQMKELPLIGCFHILDKK